MAAKRSALHGSVWLLVLLMSTVLIAARGFAQDQHTARLIEGAKKEGELVWYASMGLSDAQPLINEFERLYPFVKVRLYRTGALGVLNKILAEARAGKILFDVAESSGETLPPLIEKRLLFPYVSPERAHYENDLKDRDGFWTATYVNPWMLGYNARLVRREDVPKDYRSLLDAKWRDGKISLDTEAYTFFHGMIKAWGKETAIAYFRGLAEQRPDLRRGNNNRVGLLAAGEVPLGIAYAHTLQRYKAKQGAPVDWIPLEPVPVEIYAVSLASRAEHPNAAKLFIDFLLSKQGQEMIRDFYRVPARRDVDPSPPGLFRGYRRIVVGPGEQKELDENAKLYQQIFGTR